MKRALPFLLLCALGLVGCATDDSPGGQAARARHAKFEELGDAFKSLNDQLKGGQPNFTAIKADAAKVAALAPQLKDWFPVGSGPQDGKRTDAKAEVWMRPAEFQQAADRLAAATEALTATVATGDTAAIGASAKTVGGACKACHDKFKED